VVADQQVLAYAQRVAGSLSACGARMNLLSVPSGESSKCTAQADQLWRSMLDCHTDRKSILVAVGGGVMGDLGGFAAATYARGIDFFQVPTTLLAQVDSSVGGKVGVNLPGAKNMVGAFWQPRGVVIDPQVLESLPDRDYRAGLAEVVKYGVILDADFFEFLEGHSSELATRDLDVLTEVIARSCQLKAQVVQLDECEHTGLRAVLNYGHTFGHALEAVTGYGQLLHGEAVAIGMMCAARLAKRLGRVDQTFVDRQRRLLEALQLPCQIPPVEPAQLIAAMAHDKKVEHGRLRFVLPSRLGQVELVPGVDPVLVADVLHDDDRPAG
jgi:3-dehydroquinate synthase